MVQIVRILKISQHLYVLLFMRLLNSYKCFLDLSRPLYLIRIKEENLDKNKKLNHQKQSCEHFNRTAFNPKEIILRG